MLLWTTLDFAVVTDITHWSTHTPIEKYIPWDLLTAERQFSDGYNFFDELSIALQTLSMPLAMESKECCL
jgi:hypothetical protein